MKMLSDNPSLLELRGAWEFSTKPLAVFGSEKSGTVCVVAKRLLSGGVTGYYLFRYFLCGGKWMVSVDVDKGSADTVIRWLAKLNGEGLL